MYGGVPTPDDIALTRVRRLMAGGDPGPHPHLRLAQLSPALRREVEGLVRRLAGRRFALRLAVPEAELRALVLGALGVEEG